MRTIGMRPAIQAQPAACRPHFISRRLVCGRKAAAATTRIAANPSDVYVFNFEGVLCEPNGQVYSSAQQLQTFESPYYITSSLEAGKISDLLNEAGVNLAADSPQLFASLDECATVETLKKISERPVVKDTGARLNFLTASGKALQLAKSEEQLGKARLYLAGWSEEGQQSKGTVHGVNELEEKQFSELLSWGLIMGVDDGCGDDN